jgi:hypothetical protein
MLCSCVRLAMKRLPCWPCYSFITLQPKAQMIQHSYCFMGYFSYLDESVCSPSSILYESVCSYIIAAVLQQLQEPHASLWSLTWACIFKVFVSACRLGLTEMFCGLIFIILALLASTRVLLNGDPGPPILHRRSQKMRRDIQSMHCKCKGLAATSFLHVGLSQNFLSILRSLPICSTD